MVKHISRLSLAVSIITFLAVLFMTVQIVQALAR
jgi:hypothetical protein